MVHRLANDEGISDMVDARRNSKWFPQPMLYYLRAKCMTPRRARWIIIIIIITYKYRYCCCCYLFASGGGGIGKQMAWLIERRIFWPVNSAPQLCCSKIILFIFKNSALFFFFLNWNLSFIFFSGDLSNTWIHSEEKLRSIFLNKKERKK